MSVLIISKEYKLPTCKAPCAAADVGAFGFVNLREELRISVVVEGKDC